MAEASLTEVEIVSLRDFMEANRQYLKGRVLDFGAGKPGTCRQPQPYRDLVSDDREYVPYDKGDSWPGVHTVFDAIICTQVMQYLKEPDVWLRRFFEVLKPGGHLVMTYPTNWPERESDDHQRFTKTGMEERLTEAGFSVIRHDCRASKPLCGEPAALGYGVVAQRPAFDLESYIIKKFSSPFSRFDDDTPYTHLGIDESAAFLTGKLQRQEPFLFVRYGDGALECINALGIGHTADGEKYSAELAYEMLEAWNKFASGHRHPFGMEAGAANVFVGDWLSASFGANRATEYRAEYAKLIGDVRLNFLHFEALLLTRESRDLLGFYRAVKADTRRKVYLGPQAHAPAARMLGCEHVVTPMRDLLASVDSIYEKLAHDPFGFDVLLWGAGMAGTIPVVRLWEKFPQRTFINLGSAMDPLTRGYTRSGQLTKAQATKFFGELMA
jgi:SAM-dependent methyltransferase